MHEWRTLQTILAGSLDRFQAAARHTRQTQGSQLAAILRAQQNSAFGREHRFAGIRHEEEFRERVGLQTYESLAPYIAAHALTVEAPIAFERTGGSTAGPKLIPYTPSGLQAIQRGVFAWLDDLLQHRPGIMRGRSYWSISPAARAPEFTASGIPIGLASDAAYLGERAAASLAHLLVLPEGGRAFSSIDAWREATISALLSAPDLTLFSVWSPTFLLELLRNVPGAPAAHWPQLDTISCWTSAASASFSRQLAALFPGVHLQGKGLLATEGVVTIPLHGHSFPVLAVESGYYEFLDDRGLAHGAGDLAAGAEYEVVLTTHSGLYRYRLGDRVAVRGWAQSAPLLEFLGRPETSDLCGEKLLAGFVQPRLDRISGFRLLAPCVAPSPLYLLFLDAAEHDLPAAASAARALDRALCENPQYEYARRLKQLGEVTPVRVPDALKRYYEHSLAQGRLFGDIKPPCLHPAGEWAALWYEYLPLSLRTRH